MKKKIGVIDLTPTWEGILPLWLQIYTESESVSAREAAMSELTRMAKLADAYVAEHKKG